MTTTLDPPPTLAGSTGLADFLRGATALTLDERRTIVDQALLVLSENYVHLAAKTALYAVNPVQRLRLLRLRLERQTPATMPPEWTFHAELSEIFLSLRDLHTTYLLPRPFAGRFAYLPFLVESYYTDGTPRYVASWVVDGYRGLRPGAEITHWNGTPIDRAVAANGARFGGSNPAARQARGLQTLTIRPLLVVLPPDEEWVTVTYRDPDGSVAELRQRWLVVDSLPAPVQGRALTSAAFALGVDVHGAEAGRARALLFAGAAAPPPEEIRTTMAGVFRARTVSTPSGRFGHLRIFTFYVEDPYAFVAEFVRLVGQLPRSGLIVDVRGNSGGHLFAAEFTLQTLTPRPVEPEPLQFAATPLNLRICRKPTDELSEDLSLTPWVSSLEQAAQLGAGFSSAFPMTPPDGANAWGQRYHGPVVLVTDALCYSATDVFAAGFQDHGIGPVLGVDDNTGAGGANVWTQELLRLFLDSAPADPANPYRPLPKGAEIRVAMRRSLRVGPRAGVPLEDLGVLPDVRHQLTRADVLAGNVDLLARAGALLARMPVRTLDVRVSGRSDLRVEVIATGVDQVDLYLDGRPRGSVRLAGGRASATIPDGGAAAEVRVAGFAGGELVAARTVRRQPAAGTGTSVRSS